MLKKSSFKDIINVFLKNNSVYKLCEMVLHGDKLYIIEDKFTGYVVLNTNKNVCHVKQIHYNNITLNQTKRVLKNIIKMTKNTVIFYVDTKDKNAIDMCRDLSFSKSDFVNNYFAKGKHAYVMIRGIK